MASSHVTRMLGRAAQRHTCNLGQRSVLTFTGGELRRAGFIWRPMTDTAPRVAPCVQYYRRFSQITHEDDLRRRLDDINEKFAEARDEIEYALESAGTTYFNEEAAAAREITQGVLADFEDLLSRLPDEQREAVKRAQGLKMEQLKAELEQLDNAGDH